MVKLPKILSLTEAKAQGKWPSRPSESSKNLGTATPKSSKDLGRPAADHSKGSASKATESKGDPGTKVTESKKGPDTKVVHSEPPVVTKTKESVFKDPIDSSDIPLDYEDSSSSESEEEKEEGNVSDTQVQEEGEVSDSIASSDDGSFDPIAFLDEVELPYFWNDSVLACEEQCAHVWMPPRVTPEDLTQLFTRGYFLSRKEGGWSLQV